METPMPATPVEDDLAPLPLHEEEDVPEGSLHYRWCNYFYNVLRALFSHWFVAGNVCIFWDPSDPQKFVAPDVFLAQGEELEQALVAAEARLREEARGRTEAEERAREEAQQRGRWRNGCRRRSAAWRSSWPSGSPTSPESFRRWPARGS